MLGRVRHRTALTVQELATILGVEPDPQNVALPGGTSRVFGDRCRVVETAIWDQDAELVIERSHREWGLVVRPR
ncbi:MAG: hypothetical protein M3O77_01305, partial [Chloroflexota bacterium]|nr:hypothetical protein [Chloroflexota bacterium]